MDLAKALSKVRTQDWLEAAVEALPVFTESVAGAEKVEDLSALPHYKDMQDYFTAMAKRRKAEMDSRLWLIVSQDSTFYASSMSVAAVIGFIAGYKLGQAESLSQEIFGEGGIP